MPQSIISSITHERAYQIACTGATDNSGGSGVDSYLIYAEEITGSPSDPQVGDFNSAVNIGQLIELPLLPCYYVNSGRANWNELRLRKADGTPIGSGDIPKYGPDNVYIFNWRNWVDGLRYRIWILSVDKFGNKEPLNTSGENSLNYALFATPVITAADLAFTSTPTLTVTEGSTGEDVVAIDANGNEYSVAALTFNNLQESVGSLRKIVVDYKLSSNSNWRPFGKYQYHPNLESMSESGAYITEKLVLDTRPATYDFKAVLLNYNDIPAEESGSLLEISSLNITFDGVSKYTEYIGCKQVVMNNTNASGDLPGQIADMSWDTPVAGSFEDAYGNSVSPNTTELEKLSHYVVFMYIPDNSLDANYQRPGLTGGEAESGNWYYIDRFETNHARVTLPYGIEAAFWIGFATIDIDSQITHTLYPN